MRWLDNFEKISIKVIDKNGEVCYTQNQLGNKIKNLANKNKK